MGWVLGIFKRGLKRDLFIHVCDEILERIYEGELDLACGDRRSLTPTEIDMIRDFVFKTLQLDLGWGLACVRAFELGYWLGRIDEYRRVRYLDHKP